MRVIIITYPVPPKINEIITIEDDDYVIVVDGALDYLTKREFKIDLVIGDFDSLKKKSLLKKHQTIKLPKEKDYTDTHNALIEAYNLSNNVILIGGIKGERIDHFMANLMMLNKYPNLLIMDENTKIYLLGKGNHIITKTKYVSFFAKEDAVVSLLGFKYDLNNYLLKVNDPLGISNETLKSYAEVKVESGVLYVIQTN